MKKSRILIIMSAIFGFIGSCWFAFGAILITTRDINNLSETWIDGNTYLKAALKTQKVDSSIGMIFIAFAFLLELTSIVLEHSKYNTYPSRIKPWAIIALLIVIFPLAAAYFRYKILSGSN